MSNTTKTVGPIEGAIAALALLDRAIAAYNDAVAGVPMAAVHTTTLVALRGEVALASSDLGVHVTKLRDAIASAVNDAVDETLEQLDVSHLGGEDFQNLGFMLSNQVISRIMGVPEGADFAEIAAECFDDPSQYGDLFPVLAAE